MATAQPACSEASLLGIPLEIRHMIFEHASARDTLPKKVLRYWFEKKEVQELMAELAADNRAARAVYNDHGLEDEESEPEVDPNQEEDEDDEGDEDDEDDEDEHGDDDEIDDEEDGEDDEIDDEEDGEDDEDAEDDGAEADDETAGDNGTTAAIPVSIQTAAGTNGEDAEAGETDADVDMADAQADLASGDTSTNAAANDNGDQHDEAGEDMFDCENENARDDREAEGENDETAVQPTSAQTAPPPPPATVVRPHSKWRHIPKFVRMTRCPPPVSLFLVCKQVNAEARDWFYDVTVLRIDATASFSHFSFFEVALGQIAEAAFSPMKNIRKAEVTFVWDTTWIRAEPTGYAANVFEFFLQSRAEYVLKILQQAPDLQQVDIHWHDSADHAGAEATMHDTLEKFLVGLQATIHTHVHVIAADATPHSKSIAGKRRLEFQGIVDNPPDAF